jgi:O-antigen/teichoic acid export membrane protein
MKGEFLRDVLKLSFGTLGGRLIALAALPVVTRLYSPDDFSLLAVYLAVVSTVAVAACLRLEIAIPLAENDDDAANLLALALTGLGLVSAIALGLALVMPERLAAMLGKPQIAPYLWLVPLGIALAGTYSAFQFWTTRARRFGSIARTRVGQAATGVSVMLALGWAGVTPLGLLLGNMLNIGSGGFSLGLRALRNDREKLRAISPPRMKQTLRHYRRYPVYSTPEALFNIAGVQVPILLIAAHAGAEAGFLLLAMQVMTAPMTLLGSSISQVYMSRAPEALREGRLAPFTLSIMRRLLLVGAGPLIFAGAIAPALFPLIFGAEWARAGQLVPWLVPWMLAQFIVSPVSMVLPTVNRQNWAMVLQFTGLTIRCAAVLGAISTRPSWIVPTFAVASGVFYLIYILVVITASRLAKPTRTGLRP